MRDADEGWEEYFFCYHNGYDATRSYCSILKDDLSKKDQLKLAIISTNVLPDQFVEQKILDFEVTSVEDLDEVMDCILKHRPQIAQRLNRLTKEYKTQK